MSLPAFWRGGPSPQDLFLKLWREVGSWPAHRRADTQPLAQDAHEALVESLLNATTPQDAVESLLANTEALWANIFAPNAGVRRVMQDSIVLGVMLALDEVFLRIHPRTVRLAPGTVRRALPVWLRDAQEERTLNGAYAQDAQWRLIPRGPLSRPARTVIDANADTLTHRFSGLTAAPRKTALDDNQVLGIECCVVGQGAARGVPPATPGRETVGFAPLAEADAELVYSERRDAAHRPFLDVGVASGIDLAARLSAAAEKLGPLDLLVAPELTLDDVASARFASALNPATAPRLSVAGSGLGGLADAFGRRFNSSIAYNALGARLWSHDKVWPYGMGEHQVETCRLFGVKEGELLMEDIQAGTSLTVADIDGFGRVLTLICQDLQIQPAVSEIVRTYQPDWVIVPIMDRGVADGRWMHTTTFSLSGSSPARFVVVSSLALAERSAAADYPNTPVALLVGPTAISQVERDDGAIERAVAILACSEAGPRCGKLQWHDRSPAWKQTYLRAD